MEIKELHEMVDRYFKGNEISAIDVKINADDDFYETTMTIVGGFHPTKQSYRLHYTPKKETI